MAKTNIVLSVDHDDNVSSEDIIAALNLVVWMGQDKIARLLHKGEGCFEEFMSAMDDIVPDTSVEQAIVAKEMDVEDYSVATEPRVIVTVDGGLADWISSGGVDIVLFDRDNYDTVPGEADPESEYYSESKESMAVPKRFADLAIPNDIPVSKEADDTEK